MLISFRRRCRRRRKSVGWLKPPAAAAYTTEATSPATKGGREGMLSPSSPSGKGQWPRTPCIPLRKGDRLSSFASNVAISTRMACRSINTSLATSLPSPQDDEESGHVAIVSEERVLSTNPRCRAPETGVVPEAPGSAMPVGSRRERSAGNPLIPARGDFPWCPKIRGCPRYFLQAKSECRQTTPPGMCSYAGGSKVRSTRGIPWRERQIGARPESSAPAW